MSERAGFIAAIAADRNDRTARLVYADWLQEHGEDLAAGVLRGPDPIMVTESANGVTSRRRRFHVIAPGAKNHMAFLAVAHALGVPRPGDAHPLYDYPLAGLYVEQMSPGACLITCEYD